MAHCWYSLGRPVTIGTLMVLSVFDDWTSVRIVKNSQKTVKQQKMTIGVPIVTTVTYLPRLYQQCTNSVPIVKNSEKQSKDSQNSKNEGLRLRG